MYCGSYYNQVCCPAIGSNTAVVVAMLLKNTLPHSKMVHSLFIASVVHEGVSSGPQVSYIWWFL